MTCENVIKVSETGSEAAGGKSGGSSFVLPIALVVGVILLVVGVLVLVNFILKGRETFSHERLQENDFNNPMYQERDTEPFTLDADKVRVWCFGFRFWSSGFYQVFIYICIFSKFEFSLPHSVFFYSAMLKMKNAHFASQ